MIDRLAELVYSPNHAGITLVGMTGFQGAGKSTLITKLREHFNDQGIGFETISSDLYHKFTRAEKRKIFERGKKDGISLVEIMFQAYQHNTQLMKNHFSNVRNGTPINENDLYDNSSGEKVAKLKLDLTKKPTIVVAEGVYVLQDRAGELLDKIVFIDATKKERLERTIKRQASRPGAHNIDLEAFEAMEMANEQWILPNLKKPYIYIENTDFSKPKIRIEA